MLEMIVGSVIGTLGGVTAGYVLLGLIGRRPNTMQPVVLPPDAASDLSLGRSADRATLTKLKMIVDTEVSRVQEDCLDSYERLMVEVVANRIYKEVAARLGPEPLETQDASEKA